MPTQVLLALALLLPTGAPPSKCTGLVPCPACTTCSRCKHCKVEGGTCGACQHPDNMVIRVVDGDTIVVQVKGHPETVRLIGVDTPETKDPRKPVQYFGKEASEFTATCSTASGSGWRSRRCRPAGTDTAGCSRSSTAKATTCLSTRKSSDRAMGTLIRGTHSTRAGWRNSEQPNDQPGNRNAACGHQSISGDLSHQRIQPTTSSGGPAAESGRAQESARTQR